MVVVPKEEKREYLHDPVFLAPAGMGRRVHDVSRSGCPDTHPFGLCGHFSRSPFCNG
jgi:hypothetical protein